MGLTRAQVLDGVGFLPAVRFRSWQLQETSSIFLSDSLRDAATEQGHEVRLDEDRRPLDGLEIGVAGLAHALASVGCLTAARAGAPSCDRSWSDCPVVCFAAPAWRLELLADVIAAVGCGLESNRGMLSIVAPSIVHMHALGEKIVAERGRFRRKPDHWRTFRRSS